MKQELLARFSEMSWTQIANGAREKRLATPHQTLRLVEYSPPFREPDWCKKQHTGFVVDGQFTIQFRDHKVHLAAGDAYVIPPGESAAHQAVVEETVTLFLVEESAS